MEQVLSHVLKKEHVSISTLDASEPPTLTRVPQYSVIIPSVTDTFTALYSLIKEEVQTTEGEPKIIVFGTTANLVALYVHVFQNQTNLKVYELHSRMSQPARIKATDDFKIAKNGIMFATDGRHPALHSLCVIFRTKLINSQSLAGEWTSLMFRLLCRLGFPQMQIHTLIEWVGLLVLVKMVVL